MNFQVQRSKFTPEMQLYFTASASEAYQLVYGCGIKAHLDHAGSRADGLSLQPDFAAYRSETCPILHYACMLTRKKTYANNSSPFIIQTDRMI